MSTICNLCIELFNVQFVAALPRKGFDYAVASCRSRPCVLKGLVCTEPATISLSLEPQISMQHPLETGKLRILEKVLRPSTHDVATETT